MRRQSTHISWYLSVICVLVTAFSAAAVPSDAQSIWQRISLGGMISAIAVDPFNPSAVLVGLGNGIRQSADAGATWGPRLGPQAQITALAFHPQTRGLVIAAASGGGIYRSTDGGASWGGALPNSPPVTISRLVYARSNPPLLYGGADHALYKSADNGATWSDATGNLPLGGSMNYNLQAIDADSRTPPHLYAGRYGGFGAGLFRSQDGGDTWTQMNIVSGTGLTPDIVSVAVSPHDPAVVLAGAYGFGAVFRSLDGGKAWSRIEFPRLPSELLYINDLSFDPITPGRVVAAVAGNQSQEHEGIFLSKDNGGSWERVGPDEGAGPLWRARIGGQGGDVILATAVGETLVRGGGFSAVPNLSVARIEVSQAIQNAGRSVELVRDRPTIARIFIGVDGDQDVSGVTALLYGARNGQQLPGSPLKPINPGQTITAPRSPNAERFDHSLNFVIPSSWHPDGIMALSAQVDPDNRVVERNEDDNRSGAYPTVFFELPAMRVVLVPIEYQRNGSRPVLRVNPSNLPLFGMQGVYEMLPIGRLANTIHSPYRFTGDLTTKQGWSRLLYELSVLRASEQKNQPNPTQFTLPKYYGLLPDIPNSAWGGLAYLNHAVGVGIASGSTVAAHEIGHAFGLEHVGCGGPARPDPNYPFPGGQIGDLGLNVLGRQPMSASHFDVMSYCWPQWISAYHSEKIFAVLNDPRTRQAFLAQSEGPAWLVSGEIAPNGQSGTLSFAEPITSAAPQAAGGSGAYRLELWDNATLAYSYSFDANIPEAPDTSGLSAAFAFTIPRPNGITELRLLAGETLLDSISVASPAPTVSADLAPFDAGSSLRRVSWRVSPAVAEPDSVSVRYSADGGQSWQVLGQANDPTITNLSFDLADLAQSPNGIVSVVAVRGAAVGSAQVELGPVANKPPAMQIAQGEELRVTTDEPIVLLASAYDREDGVLEDSRFSWRDEAGQQIGVGQLLELPPLNIVTQRVVKLTVTDSDGATAEAHLRIISGEWAYLPMTRR